MKIGINSLLFRSPFTNEDLHWLKTTSEWGFDCAEIAIDEPEFLDAVQVNRALRDSGLSEIITCGIFGPDKDLRGTLTQQDSAVSYIKSVLDMMPVYGSNVFCGPIYSSVGRTESFDGATKQLQQDTVAKHLESLSDYARKRGITIALEVLNRYETDFINTADQAIELIEKVGNPALKVHLDTFHMNIEEDSIPDTIRRCGDYLAHFHASANHRGVPGKGHIPWNDIKNALVEINYPGAIVIESFTPDIKSIARAASIWRHMATPETIACEGLRNLRTVFSEDL